mgnify:CR=1 FL=1
MTEKQVILERRKIEKLFKSVTRDYKELKNSVYCLYREVGVPLKIKKKLKAQVGFTLFNIQLDYDTFSSTVLDILSYLGSNKS